MARVKVRAWRAMVLAAAAAVIGGIAPADATSTSGQRGTEGRQAYETACGYMEMSPGARTCTYTFKYTGNIDTFVVPPTTAPVRITAVGAPGAGRPGFRSRGATVAGSFPNLGGVPILVVVGGDGGYDGFNGGGLGGGGGASDVRVGGPDLDDRIIVAGGGGGWGEQLVFDENGAPRLVRIKGGDAAQPGLGSGGQPGTVTEGGAGGGTEYAPGQPGSLGRGGSGATGFGGGGGGYYGGGGGGGCTGTDAEGVALCLHSQPGSGGGGSSLVPAGGWFDVTDDPTPRVMITVTQYSYWTSRPPG